MDLELYGQVIKRKGGKMCTKQLIYQTKTSLFSDLSWNRTPDHLSDFLLSDAQLLIKHPTLPPRPAIFGFLEYFVGQSRSVAHLISSHKQAAKLVIFFIKMATKIAFYFFKFEVLGLFFSEISFSEM